VIYGQIDMKKAGFLKTVLNSALNALCAAHGLTMEHAMRLRHTRSTARVLLREGLTVSSLVGYHYGEETRRATVAMEMRWTGEPIVGIGASSSTRVTGHALQSDGPSRFRRPVNVRASSGPEGVPKHRVSLERNEPFKGIPMKPMGVTIVVAATMTALWAPGETGESPAQANVPSVVVLVTVDTLRADSVSFAGHRPITSASMDRLARDGVIFSKAYATSSWTPPSMGSVVTGLFPTSHGVFAGHFRANGEVEQPILSDTITTLAEVFDRAGYVTIGVVTNPHLMAVLGFAQGFDHYFSPSVFLPAEQLNSVVYGYLEEAFGRQWRTAMKESKTFLWIHYVDPHDPYFARRPWIETFEPAFKDRTSDYPNALMLAKLKKEFPRPDAAVGSKIRPFYDSEIAYWDHHFGELVLELGLDDPNVLLAFTSDHGEELGEHGDFGHSQSLYEELVRVPMVFRWPAAIEGGRTVTGAVSIVDLFPTLVELSGLEIPLQVQGRSLAHILQKGETLEDQPAYLQLLPDKPHLLGMRSGDWKLIIPQNGIDAPELFNLATDPGEHRNLASEKSAVVRRLQRQLDRWFQGLPPAPHPEKLQLTGEQLEELKALGYVE